MRWSRLFDDLEAELAAAERAEAEADVVEQTRAHRGQVELRARLAGHRGSPVRLLLRGGDVLEAAVVAVGQDWVGCEPAPDGTGPTLVPLHALVGVGGLAGRVDPLLPPAVRRVTLRQVLRSLSRDRAVVRVHLLDHAPLVGTVAAVGQDHLDLLEHPADVAPRPRHVRRVHALVLAAVTAVHPG